VGYPACHLAHRLELLCLTQRLFNLPPLGHVEEREDIATVCHRIVKDLDRGPSLFLMFDQHRAVCGLRSHPDFADPLAEFVRVGFLEGEQSSWAKITSGEAEHRKKRLVPGTQAASLIQRADPLAHAVEWLAGPARKWRPAGRPTPAEMLR